MTTVSPGPHVAEGHASPSPQSTKEATSKRQGRQNNNTVSWYVTLLIVGTLLLAAGQQIFQWILAIITLD